MPDLVVHIRVTQAIMKKQALKLNKDRLRAEKECEALVKKDNPEAARYAAERAVAKKTEANNCTRLAERLGLVVDQIETAARTNQVVQHLDVLVKGFRNAKDCVNPDNVANILAGFEQQMDDAGVRAGAVDAAMQHATAASTPEDEILLLMEKAKDANSLKVTAYINAVRLPQQQQNGLASAELAARAHGNA